MTADDKNELTRIHDIVESEVDDSTEFLSSRTRHLYRWWAAANGGRPPPRKMFDIIDHKPIVANLFVTDVLADGEFQFRLFGESVIRIIARNRTGERVTQAGRGEYGHELHDYYQRVVSTRACRKCVGTLMFAIGGARRFESIDCPLADEGGQKIVAIIGVMDVVK